MTLKQLAPVPRNAYALAAAALAGREALDDLGNVITTLTPGEAARVAVDAAAPEIQRGTTRRFIDVTAGLGSLFFVALWVPAAIAVFVDVAVNGTGMNRVLAGLAIVGLIASHVLMRRSRHQSERRAEELMRRADGDHWRTNGWAAGEREAVRVEIGAGLRLPWPLPGPTSTVDAVRNLTAMLRVAERRADAAEAQIAKARIVLADGRSTDALRVAEIAEIVHTWHGRADAYDDDADAIRGELVPEPGDDAFPLVTVQVAIEPGDDDDTDVDPTCVVEVVMPDGTVLGTIVGVDASELRCNVPDVTFRNVDPADRLDTVGPDASGASIVLDDGRKTVAFPGAASVTVVDREPVEVDRSGADDPPWEPGELVDGEPAVKYVLDPGFTGGEAVQLDIVGGDDMTDVSKRAEVVDPDGDPIATVVGADASAITVLTPGGYTVRDAGASDAAEPVDAPVPSVDPWADVMPSEPGRPATLADVVGDSPGVGTSDTATSSVD